MISLEKTKILINNFSIILNVSEFTNSFINGLNCLEIIWDNPDITRLLAQHLQKRSLYLTNSEIQQLLNIYSSQIISLDENALDLLSYIPKPITNDIFSIFLTDLTLNICNILSKKSFSYPEPSPTVCIPFNIENAVFSNFNFPSIETFKEGYDTMNKRIVFPTIDDISLIFKENTHTINMILSICKGNPNFEYNLLSQIFTFLERLEEKQSILYVFAFALVVISQSDVSANIKFYSRNCINEIIFNPNITLYNKDQSYPIISYLRDLAIEILLNYNIASFVQIMKEYSKYPYMMSEMFERMIKFPNLVTNQIISHSKLSTFISNCIIYYQSFEINHNNYDKESVHSARVSQLNFLAHLFSSDENMTKVMKNGMIMNTVLSLVFENNISDFIFSQIKNYLIKSEDPNSMIISMMNILTIISNKQNDFVLVTKIIEIYNYIIANSTLKRIELISKSVLLNINLIPIILSQVKNENEVTHHLIKESILFYVCESNYYKLNEVDITSLIYSIRTQNDVNFKSQILPNLYEIMAGQRLIQISPSFIIKEAVIIRVLFETNYGVETLQKIISFLIQLCHFSSTNREILSDFGIDEYLIEILENAKYKNNVSDQFVSDLLGLFTKVACNKSNTKVVQKVLQLLTPLETDGTTAYISIYHPYFIEMFYNIINLSYFEPQSFFYLGSSIITKNCTVPPPKTGFIVTFWYNFERQSHDKEILFNLSFDTDSIMTFFISQGTVFLKTQNDEMETTGKLIENIPNDDSWHFLILSFKQTNENLELVYSIDANTLDLVIVKKSSFWNKKVTIDIGYNKSENKGEYSLKIANFHLMPPFNKELLETMYDYGVTKTDDFPIKPILEVTEFEDLNQKKTNSFLDIFVRNLGCQSLMPLLLYNKMIYKDKKGEYPVIFDTAIQLISGVLHHSIESENMFVENDGIPILYNLLSKVWINTITVKNYNSLFNLFCDLQTEKLKNLFFETILVNFDFLSKISEDTQLQIYRQWEINFIAISFDHFSKFCNMKLIFASILQYFSEKPKIRKILLSICELFYFKDLKQFDTLCSAILCCQNNFGLISDLLNFLSNFIASKHDENIIYLPSFSYILLYSLKFEQVQSKVLSILFLMNENFVENFTLNIILQQIEISQENKTFLLEKFEPKLLPLFIFLFENNFTIFKNLFSVFLKKFDFKNYEKWFLYLIARYKYLELFDIMFEQYKENIDDLFVLIYMNFEEFSNEIHFLEELFVTKMVNYLYETKDAKLFELYNTIFEKVIFFHANMISPILYYENSIFDQNDKILIINSEFDIYKFSNSLTKSKEQKIRFGLKFDTKGDWIDANIALSILCLNEKTKIIINPVFDFMIFSFLNRIEFIDQKQHFSQLHGIVVNHPILKQALQFAQYSHAMKNKIYHNLIQNPFLDENESKELINSIAPFEFIDKLMQRQNEYNKKNINTIIKLNKDVKEMMMKIERKINKMQTKYHFYEDYGNQSWILLWKQLYSERGPWYNSSSDHQIMKTIRENCFCFCHVPVKICHEENYFNSFEKSNENYNFVFGCDCKIVTIRETYEIRFEITETKIVFDKKYFIEISSISKLFFRKKNSLEILLKTKEMILIRFRDIENKEVAKKLYEINHLISIEEIDLNQIKRWKKNLISNFELISYLNSFEGNSFNDIENYPIFPDINSHYINVVYSKQYVKEILTKIEENKKISFDIKSFCIPEEYCMPLFYEDIHILSQRRVELESEDNIDFVVEWINKNFSSVLESNLTKKEQKEKEIVQFDGIISNDAVVNSFIDSRSKMFTILSENKVIFGNYTLSGEANLTESKEIKLPPHDRVYFVNLTTVVLVLNSPAMFSIFDLMTEIFIVESKISEIGEITNISYTENYISFCSENASNMIYKNYSPYFTVHLFKESVVCSAISNTFQLIVSAMSDKSLIITKLQNGSLQKVIHLKNMQCRLLTITPSLGVIVSYCTKVSGGRLLHYVLSHDINGNYIGEKEIHGKITMMSSFSFKGIELVLLCKGVRFIIINALTLQTLMSTSAGEQISSISFDTRNSVLSMITTQCTIKSLKINIENELLLM